MIDESITQLLLIASILYIYIHSHSYFMGWVNCWEIASNSNCDLKSQLGFLVEEGKINLGFLRVKGKTIPWCGRKVYSLFKM